MLYHRNRKFIYQKEVKNIQNFRIIRSNRSKTNESTRDEEIKNYKNNEPIKISEFPNCAKKLEYENKKEAQLIEEKKVIKVNWEISKDNNKNNNNERRINSQILNSDKNNIISFKVKKKRNEISNNDSYLRYNNVSSDISECNNYQNSNIKDINFKEEYKVNDCKFNASKNSMDINNYKSNYMRYKSDTKKTNKRQMIKNCYNNYNYYSNRITPKKDNLSYENRNNKINNDNSTLKSDLNSIHYGTNSNSILKKKRKIDVKSVSEFPIKEITKSKNKKYDNLTYNDIEKISKKFNKIYEIDKSDIIIKDTKIISPEESNYQKIVLSKINRLSNILLSKKNNSAKNINYDSIFVRKIIEKKSKSNSNFINNDIYKIKHITFIQSCFRGYLIRKKLLKKLYSYYLNISFYSKIKKVFVNKSLREAYKKIKSYKYKHSLKREEKWQRIIIKLTTIFQVKLINNKKIFWNKFNCVCAEKKKKDKSIEKGRNIIQIKINHEKRLKLLYTGFITWAYKTKIKKYNNILENEFKFKKEENYTKIKYKNYNKKRIIRYEDDDSKIIKFLINKKSINNKDILRKYFYKWYINMINSKYKLSFDESNKNINSIKIQLFNALIKILFIKHKEKYLKDLFQKTKAFIVNNNILNNIKNINEGCQILGKYIFRNTYIHPLYCIMDKINNENIDINLMKIIMNKKKNQKELLKDIFLIWKNKVISEKKNYIIKRLFIKVINIYQKLYVKNILIKKLYHWKNISNIFKIKSNIIVQRKKLFKICDYIINENIKKNSHYFFNKIKNIKRKPNSNDLKFLKKIIVCFDKKNIIYILKRYFNKWKSFIFKYKILTLKGKMIYNLYYKYKNNIHKLLLFKYLNKWKNKNNELSKFKNKTMDCKYKELKNNNKEIIKFIMLKSILIKLNKYYIYNKINKYFNK